MRNSNRGPAFLILFATLMAAAGDGVSIVAFPWLVLQREGSAGQVIMVLCAVVGLVYGPIQPIYNYVIQTRAAQHLRGRVVGVMTSLAYAAGPLGLLLAGPLTDAAGLHATFLALALPIVCTGLVAIRLPALRELDLAPQADIDRPVGSAQ